MSYTCKEGINRYKPKFTIWGFRYVLVETELDLREAEFTAVAVYLDMEETAEFSCSNEDVNRLFLNCIWSMKSNFCDVPTDCPTRERAAWTGDVHILEENYEMMTRWYAYLIERGKKKPANPVKRLKRIPYRDYIIETGIDYGEWCEPDVKTAYRVLLSGELPGWLYEVKKGATTIWENWDGIDGNGKQSIARRSERLKASGIMKTDRSDIVLKFLQIWKRKCNCRMAEG